jgi:epoxyqueuosine reductase
VTDGTDVAIAPADLAGWAREVGLDVVGVAPADADAGWERYRAWVQDGYAAGMAYLKREDALRRRRHPSSILPGAKTVLVVGTSYAGPPAPELPHLHGRVSRYAWSSDYHVWVRERLEALVARLQAACSAPVSSRVYVDTGPVLERGWAVAAGLGFVGKNTCLIHPRLGSFVFLGVALLDIELPRAEAGHLPTCGSCRKCLDACPTGALVAPGVLDARRCLSYLTIEHRGAIPETFREAVGLRVLGCDTCQNVCPYNAKAVESHADEPPPDTATLYLPELLRLDQEAFRRRYRHTSMWRATWAGMARNAALALANHGGAESWLREAAAHHSSDLVRQHAAWALAHSA